MKSKGNALNCTALLLVLVLAAASSARAGVRPVYLYNLADFTGTVPYDGARVVPDRGRNEIYVLYKSMVRVFNDAGMEIYRFGISDAERIQDVAINGAGTILTLVSNADDFHVRRSNYRGEPLGPDLLIEGVDQSFPSFSPNRMVCQDGLLYLADMNLMRIAVLDEQGNLAATYDVATLLEMSEDERNSSGMGGFSVDSEGNMLFTIPVRFRAYRMGPDGSLASFGQPGSTLGKFNIAAGIARDSRGNFVVVDTGKYAVMIFDGLFRPVIQFGSGKGKPGELIAPRDLAIDAQDRVYVSQGRNKGVSVFRLVYD